MDIPQNRSAIKLVASDMDGTLLDPSGKLDSCFFEIFAQLEERGILFAAASGRQYYNLLEILDPVKDRIVFIAENGTYLVFQSRELLVVEIPKNKIEEIIQEIRRIKEIYPVLCGKKQAYIEQGNMSVQQMRIFERQVEKYYRRYSIVPDLQEVTGDRFLKVAVYDFNGEAARTYRRLEHFNDALKVVVSGQNWVDISHRDADKGKALELIQQKWNITPAQTMAFGDQMNDAQMLRDARYSYAMENAPEEVRQIARFRAPSNAKNGVIAVLKEMLLR